MARLDPNAVDPATNGGRIPPHNLDAERSLLGAMLLTGDAIATATETGITPDDFHNPKHGHIYDAVLALYVAGEPIDATTVTAELHQHGITHVDRADLTTITAETAASANAGHYARLVKDNADLRRLIRIGARIADLGYTTLTDVDHTVQEAEQLVYDLAARRDTTDTAAIARDALTAYIEELEARTEQTFVGVPTGRAGLDRLIMGMRAGQMLVLAARPAMGKSTLAWVIAHHVAHEHKRPVVFYSLEMHRSEIMERWIAEQGSIDGRLLREGKVSDADWHRVVTVSGRLADTPLVVDDDARLTHRSMLSRSRRWRRHFGDLGLVVVDYLQLMGGHGRRDSRQVEVAEISRAVKVMAKDLDCPVLVCSQLNREVERRQDKRPMLSDLRESGALEQDPDVVMLLNRPEVYDSTPENAGIAEVDVAKNRAGPTGVARMRYQPAFFRFTDDETLWG